MRILEAYKDYERKPKFSVGDNYFILYLPNKNYHDPLNDPLKINGDEFNDDDLLIIQTINNKSGLNASQIYEVLKNQNSNIKINIIKNSLKRRLYNFVEYKGSSRNGGYYIK